MITLTLLVFLQYSEENETRLRRLSAGLIVLVLSLVPSITIVEKTKITITVYSSLLYFVRNVTANPDLYGSASQTEIQLFPASLFIKLLLVLAVYLGFTLLFKEDNQVMNYLGISGLAVLQMIFTYGTIKVPTSDINLDNRSYFPLAEVLSILISLLYLLWYYMVYEDRYRATHSTSKETSMNKDSS